MNYKIHPGPLLKGDVIVIEIKGEFVPKSPIAKGESPAQWFLCLNDQNGVDSVQIKPIDDNPALLPRKYMVSSYNL